MKKVHKHSIALFFLIVFISVKLSNLHAISHIMDGEKHKVEHCDVCKFVLTQDIAPAINNPEFSFCVLPEVKLPKHKEIAFLEIQYSKLSAITLYNRPPPALS